MRHLLTEQRTVRLLEAIEKHLGCQIPATLFQPEEALYLSIGMQFHPTQGWEFKYAVGADFTDHSVCHELMHVCLNIEGWPRVFPLANIKPGTLDYQIITLVTSFLQHSAVNKMVSALGYSPLDGERGGSARGLIAALERGSFCQDIQQPQRDCFVGALLAEALQRPYPRPVRREIQKTAAKKYMKGLRLALSIRQVVEKYQPLDPANFESALCEVFDIIQMRKEIVRLQFPENPQPEFFQSLLDCS